MQGPHSPELVVAQTLTIRKSQNSFFTNLPAALNFLVSVSLTIRIHIAGRTPLHVAFKIVLSTPILPSSLPFKTDAPTSSSPLWRTQDPLFQTFLNWVERWYFNVITGGISLSMRLVGHFSYVHWLSRQLRERFKGHWADNLPSQRTKSEFFLKPRLWVIRLRT